VVLYDAAADDVLHRVVIATTPKVMTSPYVYPAITRDASFRLRNDLYCVGWALNSTHSLTHSLTRVASLSAVYRSSLV